MDVPIAERLVKARGTKTRKTASEELGISYRSMTAYEQGWRRPSDKVKRKLAEYYGMSIQELFY